MDQFHWPTGAVGVYDLSPNTNTGTVYRDRSPASSFTNMTFNMDDIYYSHTFKCL